MIIHVFDAGIRHSSVDWAMFIAQILAIQGKTIAIVDMSRGYRFSMVADGLATLNDEHARLPWLERQIGEEDLHPYASLLSPRSIPVFAGVDRQDVLTQACFAPTESDMFGVIRHNLPLLESRFDIVIMMSELIYTDLVGVCTWFSDAILLFGASNLESSQALRLFTPELRRKLIPCLRLAVSGDFPIPNDIMYAFRPEEFDIEVICRYLEQMHLSLPLAGAADRVEGKINSF